MLQNCTLPRLGKSNTSVEVTIHGINNKLLDLLQYALTKEHIIYQEMNEDFSLPELNAILYTSFANGLGFVALRIELKDDLPTVEKIVRELKEYDRYNNDHFAPRISMILQALGD
jgi:DNA-directed RNA polymerase subunit L